MLPLCAPSWIAKVAPEARVHPTIATTFGGIVSESGQDLATTVRELTGRSPAWLHQHGKQSQAPVATVCIRAAQPQHAMLHA